MGGGGCATPALRFSQLPHFLDCAGFDLLTPVLAERHGWCLTKNDLTKKLTSGAEYPSDAEWIGVASRWGRVSGPIGSHLTMQRPGVVR